MTSVSMPRSGSRRMRWRSASMDSIWIGAAMLDIQVNFGAPAFRRLANLKLVIGDALHYQLSAVPGRIARLAQRHAARPSGSDFRDAKAARGQPLAIHEVE